MKIITIKFLNFRTPENFVVNHLKFRRGGCFVGMMQNGIANSDDLDQTTPLGAD